MRTRKREVDKGKENVELLEDEMNSIHPVYQNKCWLQTMKSGENLLLLSKMPQGVLGCEHSQPSSKYMDGSPSQRRAWWFCFSLR